MDRNSSKQAEIEKYRSMIIAGIDYTLQQLSSSESRANNSEEFLNILKVGLFQSQEEAKKVNSLSKLKQWFRDISEDALEDNDTEYQQYIIDKTGHNPDLFQKLFNSFERISNRSFIKSEIEYREIDCLQHLLFLQDPNDPRLDRIEFLLGSYNPKQKKSG